MHVQKTHDAEPSSAQQAPRLGQERPDVDESKEQVGHCFGESCCEQDASQHAGLQHERREGRGCASAARKRPARRVCRKRGADDTRLTLSSCRDDKATQSCDHVCSRSSFFSTSEASDEHSSCVQQREGPRAYPNVFQHMGTRTVPSRSIATAGMAIIHVLRMRS